MNPNDLHWLAGVIDKGCAITVCKTGWGNRAKAFGYTVRICISSTSLSLVTKVHALTRMGYISTTPRQRVQHYHGRRSSKMQDRYTLLFHGKESVAMLEMVMPYLRTQDRRAATAIALQKAIRSRRRRQDGAVYRQDVEKIDRLRVTLKLQGTRTTLK